MGRGCPWRWCTIHIIPGGHGDRYMVFDGWRGVHTLGIVLALTRLFHVRTRHTASCQMKPASFDGTILPYVAV